MLILYTSDLHGENTLYENLVDFVLEKKPSLLLIGGDLFPKINGCKDIYISQYLFVKQILPSYISKIKRCCPKIEIGIMQGNDDLFILRKELELLERQKLFNLIDNRKWITQKGWNIIGFNLVPETHFKLKDMERLDCKYDKVHHIIKDAICYSNCILKRVNVREWFFSHNSLWEELKLLPIEKPKKTIFVSHAPPYNTCLDLLFNGIHVGSRAIRRYIERNQPILSFHGHIHESYYVSKDFFTQIGNTYSFNPGQIHYPNLDAIILNTNDILGSIEHTCGLLPPSKKGLKMIDAPLS